MIRAYLLLDQPEAALADAEELIELNPESASGFLLMGRSHERLENYLDATFVYEQAATLAEKQDDAQLTATARVSLGILLQRQRAQ